KLFFFVFVLRTNQCAFQQGGGTQFFQAHLHNLQFRPSFNKLRQVSTNNKHDLNTGRKTHSLCSIAVGGQAGSGIAFIDDDSAFSEPNSSVRRNSPAQGSSSKFERPKTSKNRFVVPYRSGRPSSSERPTIRNRSRSSNCRNI